MTQETKARPCRFCGGAPAYGRTSEGVKIVCNNLEEDWCLAEVRCETFDEALKRWDGEPDPAVEKVPLRHLDDIRHLRFEHLAKQVEESVQKAIRHINSQLPEEARIGLARIKIVPAAQLEQASGKDVLTA